MPRALLLLVLSLFGCSGSPAAVTPDESPADTGTAEVETGDAASSVARLVLDGETVRKIESTRAGVLLFREPIGGHLIDEQIARSLAWIDGRARIVAEARSRDGETFIDVVSHPSGESTLFARKGEACFLRRYDETGKLVTETALTDLDLPTDPTDPEPDPDAPPWNVGACQPDGIFETGRLAADGEDVYLVNRGGSHGVVLFRLRSSSAGYVVETRTPVAPRHGSYPPTGIVASHRVLRQRNWSWVPRVVVDDAHGARVLLVFGGALTSDVYDRTAKVPAGSNALGVVLTVSKAGVIESSRTLPRDLAGTDTITELESLRWARHSLLLVGRTAVRPPPADGLGWDGLAVRFVDGESSANMSARVHLDRGEVLSDIYPVGQTSWLTVGRSGYWQNPTGASISEEATSEAVVLASDGTLMRRLSLVQGRRHNAALTVARHHTSGALVIGGLQDGPGSHSADTDPSLRRSDGWLSFHSFD